MPVTPDDVPTGAVCLESCPTWRARGGCRCGICAKCGNQKHTAIHGPVMGEKAGSKPWGHEYVPAAPTG